MPNGRSQQIVHRLFVLGVVAKGVDGVLETIGGVLLWLAAPHQVEQLVRALLHVAPQFSGDVKLFGALFLLSHGVVKIGLVAGLLLGRHWAYPAAIGVFLLFLVYQLYRYAHTHAAWLLVLSALDMLVIALTWLEYRRVRSEARRRLS